MGKRLQKMSQLAITFVACAALCVCFLLFPELAREEIAAGKASPSETYPFLVGAWVISSPIFIALYKSYKLVSYLNGDNAFSQKSVKALQSIKWCMIVFDVLVFLGAAIVILLVKISDPTEDVTPLMMFGFVIVFTSSVIATFIAVMERLLQEAINMKSENDLTI